MTNFYTERLIQILFLLCVTFSISAQGFTVEKLEKGDLIFWAIKGNDTRAGHVAVVTKTGDSSKQLKIVHATDNPKYNSFVETHLQASEKLSKGYYFRVVRPKSKLIVNTMLEQAQQWREQKIPFNAKKETLMNKWDDSMVNYPSRIKHQLQQQLYQNRKYFQAQDSSDGLMCSDAVIIMLQNAHKIHSTKNLPVSLRVDPTLCPPSTLLHGLLHDKQNFKDLGELVVPEYVYNQREKLEHHLSLISPQATIGFYPGSFDPIHLGHDEFINTALENKICDVVIVYASGGKSSRKPNRSSQHLRNLTIEQTYKHNTAIITSTLEPLEFYQTMRDFQKSHQGIILGFLGSDVATELADVPDYPFINHLPEDYFKQDPDKLELLLSNNALVADRYLVANRKPISFDAVILANKPVSILSLPQYAHLSSTQVRRFQSEGRDISLLVPK